MKRNKLLSLVLLLCPITFAQTQQDDSIQKTLDIGSFNAMGRECKVIGHINNDSAKLYGFSVAAVYTRPDNFYEITHPTFYIEYSTNLISDLKKIGTKFREISSSSGNLPTLMAIPITSHIMNLKVNMDGKDDFRTIKMSSIKSLFTFKYKKSDGSKCLNIDCEFVDKNSHQVVHAGITFTTPEEYDSFVSVLETSALNLGMINNVNDINAKEQEDEFYKQLKSIYGINDNNPQRPQPANKKKIANDALKRWKNSAIKVSK